MRGQRFRVRVRAATRQAWSKAQSNGILLALLLLIGLTWARQQDLEPVQRLRIVTFDLYQNLAPRPAAEPKVLIVDLDERSLAEVGQWPWPRQQIGLILDRVMGAGALVFGFDVLFSEPDRLSPDRFAASHPDLDPAVSKAISELPNHDVQFAAKVKATKAVLGIFASNEPVAYGPKPKYLRLGIKNGTTATMREYLTTPLASYVGNLALLESQAVGRGLIIVPPESDNIIRRVQPITPVGDRDYPILSIEMLRVGMGSNSPLVRMYNPNEMYNSNERGYGIKDIVLQGPNFVIPTDPNGRIWPYFARYSTDRYIPAIDIINGTADLTRFKDKFVILGASAAGLRDIRSTPVDKAVPGVEVHAQIIESIIDNQQFQRPLWVERWEKLLPMAAGLLMMGGMALVTARWTALVFLALAAGGFGWSWWLFRTDLILLDVSYPVLCAFITYLIITYSRFTHEEAGRRYIKSTFGFFLSPALVEKLASDPSQMKLGGESKELTIMFSDVRGFTSISEVLTAEQLTHFMNRYLSAMTDIAQEYGAYIDKYIGDAIMAFWNAPLDDPNHARSACTAILRMRSQLKPLNNDLAQEYQPIFEAAGKRYPGIAIGMGLNTGTCVVGNMGSTQKFNYSVLGDAVNLASRLEGQTKGYHVDNLIGEPTRAQSLEFAALEVDLIRVKGKLDAVRIFTLVGPPDVAAEPEFQLLADLHARLLLEFRRQNWDAAETLLADSGPYADRYDVIGLHDVYRERIAVYRQSPPPADWDGVYTATSK
jgi:adenylate cyclase